MTKERFEVMDYFDSENKPIKAIRDTETTEIYSMDNELEANSTCEKLNMLHEEKDYWKKRALLLENKYNEGDSIEWLRNNTVWEQMPTNRKTYTKTSDHMGWKSGNND